MFIEIKSCPFCGSEDIDIAVFDDDAMHIFCKDCGCDLDTYYARSLSELLPIWNSRAAMPKCSDDKLLPCPLCGSENLRFASDTEDNICLVRCCDCGLTIQNSAPFFKNFKTVQQATAAWNTRAETN